MSDQHPRIVDAARVALPDHQVHPYWSGGPAVPNETDSDDIAVTFDHGGQIIVTSDTFADEDAYLVGIYPTDHDDAVGYVQLPHSVPAVIDYLTTAAEPPEGVDWAAWVWQWTRDAIAGGRLTGETSR